MSTAIQFDSIRLPKVCEDLRAEVREFLREEIDAGTFDPNTAPLTSAFNLSAESSFKVSTHDTT